MERRELTVTAEAAGCRLDKGLALLAPELSRSQIQTLAEKGSILRGGVPAGKKDTLREGDEIVILLPDPVPTGTQAEIEVSKELTGKVLTANMFSFTLTNTKVPAGETLAQPVTVKNDADGKVKFTLNYNKDVDADYEYEIREVNDGKAGYEYSGKVIKVTVHVGKNADNKLVTTVTYSMDGTETQDPTFVNTYTKPNPTEAELEVNKLYVNADGGAAMAIAEGQFSFVLTAKNNAPMPNGAVDGKKTVTTNAAASGKTDVLFGSISYTEAGTYTYTIEEEKG